MEVGGGEVNGNFAIWKGEIGVHKAASDTISRFGDGLTAHADNIKGRKAAIGIAFYFNEVAGKSGGYNGINF